MISCEPYPERTGQIVPDYEKRKVALIGPLRYQVRTTADELRKVAKVVAEKLNKARGPVKSLIPLKGLSSLSKLGGPLHESETDIVFKEELERNLKHEIKIRTFDVDLNNLLFAKEVVEPLKKYLGRDFSCV